MATFGARLVLRTLFSQTETNDYREVGKVDQQRPEKCAFPAAEIQGTIRCKPSQHSDDPLDFGQFRVPFELV